ncbi:DUF6492 family protein [Oscillatoria sp. CS-180]|uniref:DUF6492 family protein n=1 Tax=Oscillatoria sp. CS-180 TaxID=3021720 RepID=UPI00232D7F2A|nr:DUF6492 family protein [Oscillatoria sp. CS-180]MDB9524705.1 DUF6492 family protein [Oscillatoria sp. CS-180]
MPIAEAFDFVIPLFKVRWNTRAVLEGLTTHYQPRAIHIVTPEAEARSLREQVESWQVAPLHVHEEEPFFQTIGLSKESICAELDLGESLYTPGWFYQQLLKLGAFEGIADLSEWYMVWDSDLLPVATWPILQEVGGNVRHSFALLQHNQYGNAKIVETWAEWIRSVLKVEPLTDDVGTFVPHHMWFKQSHLKAFAQQVKDYYQSDDHWLLLMMRSANDFGTFSEYWAYVSWVAANAPEDLSFYPYDRYGETTERFFDDGTGLFSAALKLGQAVAELADEPFSPSYEVVSAFVNVEYGSDEPPSSLAFESSPRHLKKDEKNMHIEESRSRWNPRMAETART